MNRLNQKGFGAIELLLFVIVAAALVFIGFRIYSNNDSLTSKSDTSVEVSAITDSHIDFGIKNLKALSEDKSKNHVVSPTSIGLAFSMLLAGAEGESKQALQSVMKLDNLTIDQINSGNQSLTKLLNDSNIELNIANAFWTVNDFEPNYEFTDDLAKTYDAQISKGSVETINQWASDKTNNKINKIVEEILPHERFYITNAVYFKGTWLYEFMDQNTQPREFTNALGIVSQKSSMTQRNNFDYYEEDGLQTIKLPYEGGRFEMVLMLPDDINKFMTNLSATEYKRILNGFTKIDGTVYLPKFTEDLKYNDEFVEALKSLGLGPIFEPRNELRQIGENLYVENASHDVFIEVNEQGTEAAAITTIGGAETSAGPREIPKTFIMDINQPFFFAIQDSKTNEPLFMGVINNPEEK